MKILPIIGIAMLTTQTMTAQSPDKLAQIDALFREFDNPSAPGATVMVIHEGKVVFAKACGLANVEQAIPCSTNTNFRLASVSKQFTAMSVLMLAERKALSLDDPITKFFPEFPAYGNGIQVRHLLSHTSGVLAYEGLIPEGTSLQVTDRDVLHLLMKQEATYFPPGTSYRYSNSGYALLALIVEGVSGQTFPAFLRRHIFEPLGMSNSLAYVAGISSVPDRALGYTKRESGFEESDQSLTSAVLGDGGIYSSVVDLYKWDQALYTDKLISRALLQEAFTQVIASEYPGTGYGFGWYVGRHRGLDHIWHRGSTSGFTTRLERFPGKQFTVIILTNRRGADIAELGRKIADIWLF